MGLSSRGMWVCALLGLAPFLTGFSLSDGVEEKFEFVQGLQRDLIKVDHSIQVTHELLDRSAGAEFLPDVIFRLAELHVEKSRLLYYLKVETSGADQVKRSPEAQFYKHEALNLYGDLMRRFPGYRHSDRALFFMAHEYNELGLHQDKLVAYRDLADKFPKSAYLLESLYMLGEHHFDRDQLDEAEKYYRRILAFSESPMHTQARYKLGWVAVNRALADKRHWKRALVLFEQVAKTDHPGGQANDLSSQAMDGIVFCYTEVHPASRAMDYFRKLTSSHTAYVRALEKLANRYFIKEQFDPAAMLYRRIIELSPDVDKNLDFAQRIYDAASLSADKHEADQDVRALALATARSSFSWRVPASQRERLTAEFEVYARDLVTKVHQLAKKRNERRSYRAAAEAYRNYLQIFSGSEENLAMRTNRAEALFGSRQYLEAGRAYEDVVRSTQPGEARKALLYSALQAYQKALADDRGLKRAAKLEGRQAIRQLGAWFAKNYPEDPRTPTVEFNVARMLFEQGRFREARESFEAYRAKYAKHSEVSLAGHLILDCHEQLRDYQGLVTKGRALMDEPSRGDAAFDKAVAARVKQAELRMADRAVIGAAKKGEDPVDALLGLADGGQQSEELILRAFGIATDQRHVAKAFEAGGRLVSRYPESKHLPKVYAYLANLSVQTTDFQRAADLNEEFFERHGKHPLAREGMHKAAWIRSMLGQADRALRNRRALLSGATGQERGRLLLEMARDQVLAKDWRAALVSARAAVQSDPGNSEAQILLARSLAHKGKREQAKQTLLAAATPGGDATLAAEALFRLAELIHEDYGQVRVSDPSQAQESLQQKFQLLETLDRILADVVQHGDPGWAVAALYRLSAVHSDFAGFLKGVPIQGDETTRAQIQAAVKAQAEQQQTVAKSYRDACVGIVRDKRVLGPYALACVKGTAPVFAPLPRRRTASTAPSRAVIDLREALAKNPNNHKALLELARISVVNDDFHLARLQVGVVLEKNEQDAAGLNLMGLIAWHLGEDQQALGYFSQALKQDPRLQAARWNLAGLLAAYGDRDGARKVMGHLRHTGDPGVADVHSKARLALAELGGGG